MADEDFVTKEVCILKHERVESMEEDIKEINKSMKAMADKRIANGWKILGAVIGFLALAANIVIAVWKR